MSNVILLIKKLPVDYIIPRSLWIHGHWSIIVIIIIVVVIVIVTVAVAVAVIVIVIVISYYQLLGVLRAYFIFKNFRILTTALRNKHCKWKENTLIAGDFHIPDLRIKWFYKLSHAF